jgi:hypothetical protein
LAAVHERQDSDQYVLRQRSKVKVPACTRASWSSAWPTSPPPLSADRRTGADVGRRISSGRCGRADDDRPERARAGAQHAAGHRGPPARALAHRAERCVRADRADPRARRLRWRLWRATCS